MQFRMGDIVRILDMKHRTSNYVDHTAIITGGSMDLNRYRVTVIDEKDYSTIVDTCSIMKDRYFDDIHMELETDPIRLAVATYVISSGLHT